MVIIEAMSCGLPVVVSAVGGSVDIVEDGENGVHFEKESPEALARSITMLLGRTGDWSGLGQEARARAVACADIDVLSERVSAAYGDLEST